MNYLLVIRGPYSTGDLALKIDLRWPVPLSTNWAHQDKAISVGNQGLSSIMGPGKVTYLSDTPQIINTCERP